MNWLASCITFILVLLASIALSSSSEIVVLAAAALPSSLWELELLTTWLTLELFFLLELFS